MRLMQSKNRPTGTSPAAMSVQKIKRWGQISNKDQQEEVQQIPYNSRHMGSMVPTNVKGVNSSVDTFNILVSGTQGGHLWTANLSSWPSQQKRLMTVLGGSTFLVNYALDSYPSRISLAVNEATGSLDQQGNPSHIIAVLVPSGPATPVQNPGNIIGYNVTYTTLAPFPPIDISNIPQLTFDAYSDNSLVPVGYPLASAIALIIQVTHVMF